MEMSVVLFDCFCLDTDVKFLRKIQKLEMFATDFSLVQRQAICAQRCLEFLKAEIEGINKMLEEVQFTLDPGCVVTVNIGWA